MIESNLLLPQINTRRPTVTKEQRGNSNANQDDSWLFRDPGNFSPNMLNTLLICWSGKFHQWLWSALPAHHHWMFRSVQSPDLDTSPKLSASPTRVPQSPSAQRWVNTGKSSAPWLIRELNCAEAQLKLTLKCYDTPGRWHNVPIKKAKPGRGVLASPGGLHQLAYHWLRPPLLLQTHALDTYSKDHK